jgi:high-affinity nickel permease
MFGLDERIADRSDGTTLLIVVGVAAVLGLCHATDPDHLAAVTALIAAGDDRARRAARRLGFFWGLGHATTLFVFGLPIIFFSAYLPARIQQGAETAVGVIIVAVAVRLLLHWRRGTSYHHAHRRVRMPLDAYVIGLVHGMGGSAGVGLLLLAGIQSRGIAVTSLAVFALFTTVSMSIVSAGWGIALGRTSVTRSLQRIMPALGVASLAYGVWYVLGALTLVPYLF